MVMVMVMVMDGHGHGHCLVMVIDQFFGLVDNIHTMNSTLSHLHIQTKQKYEKTTNKTKVKTVLFIKKTIN